MTSYEPRVRCYNPPGPPGPGPEGCDEILYSMPTGMYDRRFGRAGAPGVNIGLPAELSSGKSDDI